MEKTKEEINQKLVLSKLNNIDKPLAGLIRKNREKTQVTDIKNDKSDILRSCIYLNGNRRIL